MLDELISSIDYACLHKTCQSSFVTSQTFVLFVVCFQVMKDTMGNPEAQRRASFYDQQWCVDAVPRYFYAKVNQRKSDLESALGIRNP